MTGTTSGSGCVFCDAAGDEGQGQSSLVVHRGSRCYVILNLYPYNNGHLMIVPARHISALAEASPEELGEMMALTRIAELALTEAYQPHGLNVGINLGRAAGAGIADHLHMHVVPRWAGDTNFMTVVGDIRVLPEDLAATAVRLRPIFERFVSEPARR